MSFMDASWTPALGNLSWAKGLSFGATSLCNALLLVEPTANLGSSFHGRFAEDVGTCGLERLLPASVVVLAPEPHR